jgi:hypothetical protein
MLCSAHRHSGRRILRRRRLQRRRRWQARFLSLDFPISRVAARALARDGVRVFVGVVIILADGFFHSRGTLHEVLARPTTILGTMALHLQKHECLALSGIRGKGQEIGDVLF